MSGMLALGDTPTAGGIPAMQIGQLELARCSITATHSALVILESAISKSGSDLLLCHVRGSTPTLPAGLDLCIAYHSSKRNNTKCMDLVSHGAPVFRSTQRHMINRVYLCEDAVLHRPHRSLQRGSLVRKSRPAAP